MKIDFTKFLDSKFYFENVQHENGFLFESAFLGFAVLLMFSGFLYTIFSTILRPKKTDSVEILVRKLWAQKFANQVFWTSFLGVVFGFFRSENAGQDYFLLMRIWMIVTAVFMGFVFLMNIFSFIKVLPKDINQIKRKMEKEMYIKGGRKNEK
ncbi:MAG: hypothetical protein Fur0024_0440 [Patescibacteria group bacterium]